MKEKRATRTGRSPPTRVGREKKSQSTNVDGDRGGDATTTRRRSVPIDCNSSDLSTIITLLCLRYVSLSVVSLSYAIQTISFSFFVKEYLIIVLYKYDDARNVRPIISHNGLCTFSPPDEAASAGSRFVTTRAYVNELFSSNWFSVSFNRIHTGD